MGNSWQVLWNIACDHFLVASLDVDDGCLLFVEKRYVCPRMLPNKCSGTLSVHAACREALAYVRLDVDAGCIEALAYVKLDVDVGRR